MASSKDDLCLFPEASRDRLESENWSDLTPMMTLANLELLKGNSWNPHTFLGGSWRF